MAKPRIKTMLVALLIIGGSVMPSGFAEQPVGDRVEIAVADEGEVAPAIGWQATISADARIGLIGALVGAGIGALVSLAVLGLSIRAQDRRAARRRSEQARVARVLVESEIAHNLRVMAGYLADVDLDNPIRTVANQSGEEWIASHPAPRWWAIAFEANLSLRPDALSEQELLATHEFYTNLWSHTAAIQMAVGYKLDQRPYEMISTAFFVLRNLEEGILRKGNPLRQGTGPTPG